MMTTGTMSLEFGVGTWSDDMHDAVSCASHSYVTASQVSAMYLGVTKLKLAWDLRCLSDKLSRFLDSLYAQLKMSESGKVPQGGAASREDVKHAERTLEYLYEITNRLYEKAAQKKLTNHSFMAGSLRSIHKHSEELLDLADWLHVSLESKASELDALYSEARADLAKGEVFTLA